MLRLIETKSWHVFGKFPTIPTLCSKGYQCRQTLVPGGAEGDDGLMACIPWLDTVLQIRRTIRALSGRYWLTEMGIMDIQNSGATCIWKSLGDPEATGGC